ncbi:hypothetical protein [Burkholderia thailandensis]|uniref:Uncharacterized protein n=2 Tax=Burkholderia thailandensis TaxID=57975 RepID=A0AAW9CU10_BURTH|nr:hypothetical protein [Burkholderia thailandensis]ABC34426.1 conserved hypothetical protein [Burkholderia thailandensis E264]AHI67016.1 hypothetical protein BTL_3984 [Burkholderia thailandensis H0587]AHI75650.1 hypothetical protein BTQ_4539 [Burkholderia thailandensis 2002721723]AHI81227.1 hypothetical protein BTJ_5522 [Burkholderia thailandensis E444]AIC89489.1 hypothetical protein BTRA_4377 [Burkholderia thailandensis USAMRU Malaysia \
MIPCDVCRPLASERHPASSDVPLDALGKPTKLRPLLRKPVVIAKFRCRACGANWISESDAAAPGEVHWLFLGDATSILEPGARRRRPAGVERAAAAEPPVQPADAERIA